MPHVELNLKGDGRGSITIDGVDWSNAIRGIELSSEVGDTTTMTVHLTAPTVDGEWDARLRLPAAVQELLIKLGWTPPA